MKLSELRAGLKGLATMSLREANAFLSVLWNDYVFRHMDVESSDSFIALQEFFERTTEITIRRCAHTGAIFREFDGYDVRDHGWWCSAAFEEAGVHCSECSTPIHYEDSTGVIGGDRVCSECLEEYYEHCDCEGHYVRSGECECPDEDDPSVLRASGRHNNALMNYSTDVLNVKEGFRIGSKERAPGNVPFSAWHAKNLWLGVELEVERKRDAPESIVSITKDYVDSFAIVKSDGSLGPGGFEIVSVPGTRAWHEEVWDRFFEKPAKHLRSWTTDTCGMHVHVNVLACTPLVWGRVICFMNSVGNRGFVNWIAGREVNEAHRYARTSIKSIKDSVARKSAVTTDRLGNRRVVRGAYGVRVENDRYGIVNTRTRQGKTVEFRLFRGNVSRDGFMKNLDFVVAIIEFCRQTSNQKMAALDFIDWFVQPENATRFPYLARALRSSGRAAIKSSKPELAEAA